MQIEIPIEFIAWAALILSIFAILLDVIIVKISLEKHSPIIELNLENPPPYDNHQDESRILIKNIGERETPIGIIKIRLDSPRFLLTPLEMTISKPNLRALPGETVPVPVKFPDLGTGLLFLRISIQYKSGFIFKKTRTAMYEREIRIP